MLMAFFYMSEQRLEENKTLFEELLLDTNNTSTLSSNLAISDSMLSIICRFKGQLRKADFAIKKD